MPPGSAHVDDDAALPLMFPRINEGNDVTNSTLHHPSDLVEEVSVVVVVLRRIANLIAVHGNRSDQPIPLELFVMVAAEHDLMCVPLIL
jgi:hypothetical protein